VPEIALNDIERLADRLLGEQAARLRETIQRLQQQHQGDVSTFVAGVFQRAGVTVPPTANARRVDRDGLALIEWQEVAPSTTPAPDEPDVDAPR
jgi:hypothetical protein